MYYLTHFESKYPHKTATKLETRTLRLYGTNMKLRHMTPGQILMLLIIITAYLPAT